MASAGRRAAPVDGWPHRGLVRGEAVQQGLDEVGGCGGGGGCVPEAFADRRVVHGDRPGDVPSIAGLVVELDAHSQGFVAGDGGLVRPGPHFPPVGVVLEEGLQQRLADARVSCVNRSGSRSTLLDRGPAVVVDGSTVWGGWGPGLCGGAFGVGGGCGSWAYGDGVQAVELGDGFGFVVVYEGELP